MKTSIFIRTYAKDAEWLSLCIDSLLKFAQGFHEIVVIYPSSEAEQFSWLHDVAERHADDMTGEGPLVTSQWEPRCANGYIDQQITKIHADEFCEGDFILHIDSDCIAQVPFKPEEFFIGARPMIAIRKWEDVGDAICWREPVEKTLDLHPTFETMACMPIIHNRSLYPLFRQRIQEIHGKSADDYIAGLTRFSEFNALGSFAHQYLPDWYHFVRVSNNPDIYPRPVKQYWSYGGIPEELK